MCTALRKCPACAECLMNASCYHPGFIPDERIVWAEPARTPRPPPLPEAHREVQEAVRKTELSWSIAVSVLEWSLALGWQDPERGPGQPGGPQGGPRCCGECQLAAEAGLRLQLPAHFLCDLGQVTCPAWAAGSHSPRRWTVPPETRAGRHLEARHGSLGYFYQDCGQSHRSSASEPGQMQGSPKVMLGALLCLRLGWLAQQALRAQSWSPAEPRLGCSQTHP